MSMAHGCELETNRPIRIHELWTYYCLLGNLVTIIISSFGSFLFPSMSCRHVTAYWMICPLLLLHPRAVNMLLLIGWFVSNYYYIQWAVDTLLLIGWFVPNYYYIHELWICYCLLDDLSPIIITSNELWTCYCLLDDLSPIIITSNELWTCYSLLNDLSPIIITSIGSFFFIRIHELWTWYCLLDVCLQLLLHPWAVNMLLLIEWFASNYYYIHELWTCYCLLDDLPPIIITSIGSFFFIRIYEL